MNYTLRPEYQVPAVERGLEFFSTPFDKRKKPQHGVVVLPTGAGKSLVIGSIATRLDAPVLVLQHTKEILEQNAEKIESYGFKPAIYSASVGKREVARDEGAILC